MKKKILTIFFTLLFCLPCMYWFSACKNNNNNIKVNVTKEQYVSILKDNGKFSGSENIGTNLKYNIYLSDSYDHTTLKIYNDKKEVPWTLDEQFSQNADYVTISDHKSKVGYFEIKNVQKDINLSFDCNEREIKIKFSTHLDNEITEEKQAMLNDFNLNQTTTLYDAVTSNYELTTTYSQLKSDGVAKLFLTCNKSLGFYATQTDENGAFIDDLNPEAKVSKNTYSITLSNLLKNNKIIINTDNLTYNTFKFSKENLEIIDITSNDALDPIAFASNSVGKFIIQVDGLNQANLNNAKLFIGTTPIDFNKETGEYELDIENKCPIDYGCKNLNEFDFSLTGVVFETSDEICKIEYTLEKNESVNNAYYADETMLYYDLSSTINLTLKFSNESSIILNFNFKKANEEPYPYKIDLSNHTNNPLMSDIVTVSDKVRGIKLSIHFDNKNGDNKTTVNEITQIDVELTPINGSIEISK